MRRKLIIASMICFFVAGLAAYGLCSSETTNLGLSKPTKGDRNWGQTVNNNMDKLDAAYGNYVTTSDDLPQVYVYSNTFNSTTGRTITLPNEVDAVTEYSVTVTPTTRAGAIGDIYVTKTTTNFVVKCSEANTTDTFAAVVYYTGDASQYGGSIYRRWYVSPDSSITDHGNASTTGSLAWVAAQISTSPAVIEAPGNKNYQLKQNLTLADNISYQPQPGAIIDTDFSIRDSNYEWYQNGATSEYYLQASGGGNPNINMPNVAIENSAQMTEANAGSLAAGEWDWNDVNGLGYSTVYVRLSDSTDPDGKSADYVEAGYLLTINGPPLLGLRQAFSGEGNALINSIDTVRARWWNDDAGDGVTDCTFAFNAAITSFRTNDAEGTLLMPAGTYIVSSIDATDMYGFILRGVGSGKVVIKGTAAGKNVIDLTSSLKCKMVDFTLEGDSTNVPKVGFLAARETAGGSAGRHVFENISTTGNFSVAALYSFASEKNTYINSVFINSANSANCVKISNDNPDSITSDFQTLAASGSSTSHNFFNTTCWYYGTSGYALWADEAHNITYVGGAITTPGITSDISFYVKDTYSITFMGTRFEVYANTAHIRFAGNCSYIDFLNCNIGHATNSIDAEAGVNISNLNVKSFLEVGGNKIDLSNALLQDSFIYFGSKELEIGPNSVDCVFEGLNANFTDAAGTARILIRDDTKIYLYGGGATIIYEAVDPPVVTLVKLKGTLNSEYVEFQDGGGVSRHQFAASGYAQHSTGTTLGREVMKLDQNDEDKGFIDYEGTSEAGATKSISSWTTGGSMQGFVRMEINGVVYWMPYYSAPTGS